MWQFTIGLFWAAFKRESGSCLESRVSWHMGDVGGFVGLHHLRESREGTMEEGVKTFSPTRDRTFSSPSVPPSSTKLRATSGGWQPELGGRTRRPDYF